MKFLLTLLCFFSITAKAEVMDLATKYYGLYQPFFITGNDLIDKITNDRGNGYEDAYGTRNMRVVLHGVMYRGGSNNSYNKYGKRDNQNPMPQIGLDNLCKEGFSSAVYLYTTNFKPYKTICIDRGGKENSFEYVQVSPSSSSNIKRLLSRVYDTIQGKTDGPSYFGCWNGWHYSGLISAIALKQWCNFTGTQAVQYWIDGTDSVSNSNYPEHKKTIMDYKVDSSMPIEESVKQVICPRSPY